MNHLVKRKGKSPHKHRPMDKRKRPRGSRPDEILYGIYAKGGTFICPITGEDPAVYFRKYKRMYILQRMHHPASYAELVKNNVKNPNDIQYVIFGSPNGHNMLENYMKGITTMKQEDNKICYFCGINSWDMYLKHNKVLTMENHHVSNFGTFPHCPTCHAATDDHSVNTDKFLFPAERFAELLDNGILNLDTLHTQLKKYNPKLTKQTIQIKFYAMGLQRFYNNKYIPVPKILKKFFQNTNSTKFFEEY
jgi:hypothetical protein